MGTTTPAVAYVGSIPMRVDAALMSITVATSAPRLPYLSPTWPKMMSAPIGRAIKAALKLRNAETVEATGSLLGKNNGAKTIAAVVPNRRKSHHSRAVPTFPGLDGPGHVAGAGAVEDEEGAVIGGSLSGIVRLR